MAQEIRFGKGEKLGATKLNRLSDLAQNGNPLSSDEYGQTGRGWYKRAKNAVERIFKPRFGVYKYGPTGVRVRVGSWTRNGTKVTLTTDVGENYKTLSGFSSSGATYYVYVELSDWRLPLTLTADKQITTEPADDYQNVLRVIASVYVDSTGEVSKITQFWTGGDIDDQVDPDDQWVTGEDVDSSPTCYADEIWDGSGTFKAIDLNNSILRNSSGHAMVSWDENSGGRVEVGDTSNGKDLKVYQDAGTSTGGSVYCGASYFLSKDVANEWRDDHFHVHCDGTVNIEPETDSTDECWIGNNNEKWQFLYIYCDDLIINGGTGWSGTFTNGDGNTVEVTNGIITDIY